MDTVPLRLRSRLLPALLTALGLALLANGLMSYTTAVQPPPEARALASYEPLPTLTGALTLPGGGGAVNPSFPPGRVATRIVIRRLNIDLPVILQDDKDGLFPLCDVALYQPLFGQPGQGRATYIYAHARVGMFLPLLRRSERADDGQSMIGMTVEVYTSDDWRFVYTISEVRRHTRDLNDAAATTTERLWLQTSEGPMGTVPKLQVVADFLSAAKVDPVAAHPAARPRICR
ncbi:MAG: hypothetical protein HYX55_04555 [Chloroflexi bacterium]|nr:hypothetical protein [Chloroflexota bacterium]